MPEILALIPARSGSNSIGAGMKVAILLLGGALLAAGCTLPVADPRPDVLLTVPFRVQEPQQCGAAALGMVLSYWAIEVPVRQLEAELFVPALRGTIPALVVDAARRHGLQADCRPATMDMLRASLEAGQPPIVFLGPERKGDTGHFAVLTGLRGSEKEFRLHGPSRPDEWWRARQFHRRWREGGRLTLFGSGPRADGMVRSPSS